MGKIYLKDFDPAIMGSENYITGTFHGYFKENMDSTLVPITKNLTTKGYVPIHLPMTVIIDQKEQNEELYLKFVDSRSGQTIGNRVTTILWRGKNETQK